MTMGCFFTCPEVKGGSVEPCQHQSNPVEAYCGDPLCFHSAASSIVLSPDPWHRNDWEDFTTPFDAVRQAMTLRAQVLQDVWMQEPFPLSMQMSSSPCKHRDRRKSTVGFNENVELIIVLDGECKVNIQTSFTHEQLNDWVTKPWTLRKNDVDDTAIASHPVECWTPGVPCRNRIPQTNLPAIESLSQVEVGLVDNDCPKSPSWNNRSIDTASFTPLRYRLVDERISASASVGPDAQDFTEEQGQHDDLGDDQLVIIDGWQDLLDILHQHAPSPDSLIHLEMYGLHITHHSIRITECEATIAAIREAIQESWRDAMPPRSVAYIHLVRPQEQRHARAVVLQMIVEIVPFGVDIPPNDAPILRRIRWHRDHSMTLETAYMRDRQTGFELLFDAHLDEWCHPRHGVQCNLHIESRIALMAHRHQLLPGSLLEIFIHDDARPEPPTSSQQAELQTQTQHPIIDNSGPLQERLADWRSPQAFLVMYGLFGSSLGTRYSTSQADYQQVRATVYHVWQDYVLPDTSVTLHMVRPQDDRQPDHLHLIVELTSPSQARPAGYLPILQRISWHNIWQSDTSAAVYRVPGQNMREMLAACSLAEWCGPSTRAICRIQVERRSIPTVELIEFQIGSLLEVLVSLQQAEEDDASLLQSGAPVAVLHQTATKHVEPSNAPLGSLSTHVYDRWCDSLSSCDVQKASAKNRITQLRPNGDIVPNPDNQAPYQYRLHNGARIMGTIIPPPNWNRLPGLRYAADRGAVVRDVTHQLRIRIRSWLVPHDRFGPMYWKDCTIPAQLFLRLLDRLQSVWQPELRQDDRLSMRIVQPTPAPPVGGQARLYILLECNRPRVGARKAILLSFQEFYPEGPSPDMTWIPYLAPEVITLPIIAGVLPAPCDPRHLIVSAGTPDRRWLAEHEERVVTDGLYLPILRDVRRAVPTQRMEVLAEDTGSSDDSSLLQWTSHVDLPALGNNHLIEQPPCRVIGFLSTHVIDKWCDSLSPLSYEDSTPSIRTLKPNPNIVTDFDDEIPYQRRTTRDGETIITRDVPPPNWAELPIYMVSSSLQAVARDGAGHLQVYFRTWLLHHNRDSPVESRDGQIRAQLMVDLHSRIRRLWRSHINPGDTIKTTVVRPNPVLDRNEGPMLLLLVECNRPIGSPTRPILLTFQEIDARGPEPQRSWRAYLAPPTINLQYLADRCACEPFHIIAPLGTEDRRWIGRDQSRPVVSGRYIPIWFDLRRPPFSSIEPADGAGTIVTDDSSFMQRGGERECSRSPRRAAGTTPLSTQSSSTHLLAHVFRLSREHRALPLDRASPQTLSEQVRTHWAAPERHGYTDLHTVSWPPDDLESTADETYIAEFAVDRQRQADPADRLILVDVKIQGSNPTVTGSHLRRVLWSRGFMTREDMLHLLSSANLCKLTTIQCTLEVNHNQWPPGDGVRRQMMHGDFVQLNVLGPDGVPSSHIQVALCEQEAADSQRFIYHASPSPSPEPTTPIEEAEGSRADGTTPVEDDHSDRTSRTHRRRRVEESDENLDRSTSVSLLQQRVSYKSARVVATVKQPHATAPDEGRENEPTTATKKSTQGGSPLADVTNLNRFVARQDAQPASQPDAMNSSGLPHVADLWCARPVDFKVPDCLAEPKFISLNDLIPSPPEVVIPCQHLQFVRNQLLQFSLGTPGTVSQLVKWHSSTQTAFDETPPWTDELPISYELFTDGSSAFLESSRNGAAAVVLIVNTVSGPRFGGTHCFHVDAPATAPRAEIVAMLGAVLWAVELASRHPSTTPHFRLGFDNTLAGNAAAGYWSPSCHLDLQTCIRSLCHWMQARFGDDVFEWAHVKAHSGHPWNEAADALSWAAVAQWITVQPLLECLPDLLLVEQQPGTHEWLWLLEYALQHRPGTPRVDSLGFHFRLDHPFEQQPQAQEHPLLQRQRNAVAGPRIASSFTLRCSTANVLTLQSRGLGARAEHLASQFLQAGVHCIGLQETRSHLSGHYFFDEFHVLSAPSAKGVGGVQFWIRRTWSTEQGTLRIQPSDLRILASTSQRIVVCLRHPDLHLLFVVCHAPSDGNPATYDDYWQTTSRSIPAAYRNWRQIYLTDANARVGGITSAYIGGFGAVEENLAGSCFHQWMTTQSLVAPQTFEAHHRGPHFTWTHANGDHRARLDYILVDSELYSAEIRTWVSQDIDLSLDRADHECVCADIPVSIWPRRPARKATTCLSPVVTDYPPAIPWATDVHSHAAQVQQWLASHTPARTLAQPRKKHLSYATWFAVQQKKYHFKRYSWCKQDLARHTHYEQCSMLGEDLHPPIHLPRPLRYGRNSVITLLLIMLPWRTVLPDR